MSLIGNKSGNALRRRAPGRRLHRDGLPGRARPGPGARSHPGAGAAGHRGARLRPRRRGAEPVPPPQGRHRPGLRGARRAEQFDIENMGLLYYDEVLRGVEARIRDQQLVAADHLHAGRDTAAGLLPAGCRCPARSTGCSSARASSPPAFIARLATRVPVVVIAGDPGERAADVVTADNRSGSVAIVTHLIADHGKRRLFHVDGPPNSPDAGERRPGAGVRAARASRHCQLVGSTQGIFSVRSGEQAGENLLAEHARRRCRTRWCAPTTRWRSACCRRFARAGRARPRGGGRGRLRRHLPRQPVRPPAYHGPPADAHARRAGLRPRCSTGSPTRACAPTVELLPTELVLRSSCGCPPGTVTRQPVKPLTPPGRGATAARTGNRGARRAGPRRPIPQRPGKQRRLGAAMSFILRRLVFYVVAAWVALTINFFIPRADAGERGREHHVEVPQPAALGLPARSRRCSAWDTRARSGISTGRISSTSSTSTSAPTSPSIRPRSPPCSARPPLDDHPGGHGDGHRLPRGYRARHPGRLAARRLARPGPARADVPAGDSLLLLRADPDRIASRSSCTSSRSARATRRAWSRAGTGRSSAAPSTTRCSRRSPSCSPRSPAGCCRCATS